MTDPMRCMKPFVVVTDVGFIVYWGVSLLVLLGLPGTLANGTNRVGILAQNLTAAWRFRAEGVAGLRSALPVLLPVAAGSAIGAVAVSRLADATFERLFALLMIGLLIPTLRGVPQPDAARRWRRWITTQPTH